MKKITLAAGLFLLGLTGAASAAAFCCTGGPCCVEVMPCCD